MFPGKYVGSRPITIKKATTQVRAVEIGDKKAKKLEADMKKRHKEGGLRSQRGGGVQAGHGGQASCAFLFGSQDVIRCRSCADSVCLFSQTFVAEVFFRRVRRHETCAGGLFFCYLGATHSSTKYAGPPFCFSSHCTQIIERIRSPLLQVSFERVLV